MPQVAGPVARRVLRVAGAAVDGARAAAPIERQETRSSTGEARRHVDFVRISGEVDECTPFETEERRVGVAVLPVLTDGIAPGLAGHWILEFACGYRYAVERKDEVDGIGLAQMTRHLPSHGELVAFESSAGIGVEAVGRCKVRDSERTSVEPEAVTQHFKYALEV